MSGSFKCFGRFSLNLCICKILSIQQHHFTAACDFTILAPVSIRCVCRCFSLIYCNHIQACHRLGKGILRNGICQNALEVNQERYKKVQFQAVYANCVVVLKYPDDTCQYIVADKNSEFLLPAENEKYKEIRWEGCTIGEKIVITGDREFLVAEYKLQDGAADAPWHILPETVLFYIFPDSLQARMSIQTGFPR